MCSLERVFFISGFFIIHFTIIGPKNTVRYIRYVGVTLYRGLRYMGVRYIGALLLLLG